MLTKYHLFYLSYNIKTLECYGRVTQYIYLTEERILVLCFTSQRQIKETRNIYLQLSKQAVLGR